MIANNAYKYQQNVIMTASPQELTLMLYNGAIKFCNLGVEAIDNKNIEEANRNIIKAQKVIEELQMTLDDKYSISKEIRPLYEYINVLLIEANISKNREKVLEAKELISEFRDLWKEVIRNAR